MNLKVVVNKKAYCYDMHTNLIILFTRITKNMEIPILEKL